MSFWCKRQNLRQIGSNEEVGVKKMSEFREKLHRILEEPTCRAGRTVAWIVQGLIVLSLFNLSLHTLPNLSDDVREYMHTVNIICMLLFTIEYILRVYSAPRRRKFVFSFFGMVDLLAIVPYYLSLGGFDSRSLRAFRLLRLFQLFKLARYNSALRRYYLAFMIAKEELTFFLSSAFIIIFLAAIGIYQFENPAQPEAFASVFHSLWWAVATLTTVGYGDIYPITMGGKIFTFAILFVGLGVVSVPAGMVASALTEARNQEHAELERKAKERIEFTQR